VSRVAHPAPASTNQTLVEQITELNNADSGSTDGHAIHFTATQRSLAHMASTSALMSMVTASPAAGATQGRAVRARATRGGAQAGAVSGRPIEAKGNLAGLGGNSRGVRAAARRQAGVTTRAQAISEPAAPKEKSASQVAEVRTAATAPPPSLSPQLNLPHPPNSHVGLSLSWRGGGNGRRSYAPQHPSPSPGAHPEARGVPATV
jgi:hypothetical protein